MDQEIIKEFKEKLEKEKKEIEDGLSSFASKDKKLEGDWDTRFPKFNGGGIEEAADEVEEYSNLLPQEYNLELKLKQVNSALDKINKGKYGICEKCEKEIEAERLKVYPEAKTCTKCK